MAALCEQSLGDNLLITFQTLYKPSETLPLETTPAVLDHIPHTILTT